MQPTQLPSSSTWHPLHGIDGGGLEIPTWITHASTSRTASPKELQYTARHKPQSERLSLSQHQFPMPGRKLRLCTASDRIMEVSTCGCHAEYISTGHAQCMLYGEYALASTAMASSRLGVTAIQLETESRSLDGGSARYQPAVCVAEPALLVLIWRYLLPSCSTKFQIADFCASACAITRRYPVKIRSDLYQS